MLISFHRDMDLEILVLALPIISCYVTSQHVTYVINVTGAGQRHWSL